MRNSQIQSEAAQRGALNLSGSLAGQKVESAPKLEDYFVKLFNNLRIPMSRYLRRVGLSPEDSEEIVQEAFLRLFKHLREEGREDNLRGWVYRVAHNLAIDRYKDQRRFTTKSPQEWAGLDDLLRDQSLNPEELLMDQEEVARVDQAIASLSSRQFQCVYLRTEGFRYREIAETLGVTMATVAESLRRASKKLREDET